MKKIIDTKKIVLSLKPYPIKKYENLDLDSLVVYTLALLEAKSIPLYFDYISVGLFKLFPQKFSLSNFEQYPDAYRINNAIRRTTGALSDREKTRWANGSPEHGFSLTDTGREIAKQVARLLENPQLQKTYKKSINTRSRGRSSIDDVREVRESEAFKKWQNDQEVNNHEFFAFLKATSYTPKQLLVDHLKLISSSANITKDEEVIKFLEWLQNKFNNLLY